MIPRTVALAAALALLVGGGCTSPREDTTTMRLPSDAPPVQQTVDGPPVALNADVPVSYPAALLQERIDGTVVLRLFADERGGVVPESTRVAESSGYPAFDSAAAAGASGLRFAPALRDGRPVAAAFLQPVHFRHAPAGK